MRISPEVTRLETREHAQSRRLAATRWPKQHDKLAIVDLERQIVDDARAAKLLLTF
jgi:hypothetical protein